MLSNVMSPARGFTRQPESPNVHIWGFRPSKTQPKLNEKTQRKERNWGREREKREILGDPAKVVREGGPAGVRRRGPEGPNQQQPHTNTNTNTTTANHTTTTTTNNQQHNTKMDWPKMDWPKLDWPKSAITGAPRLCSSPAPPLHREIFF